MGSRRWVAVVFSPARERDARFWLQLQHRGPADRRARGGTNRTNRTHLPHTQAKHIGAGTHHELMGANTTYREIVLSQLTEEEAA